MSRKKNGSSSGVAPSAGEVDRHLNTFECHEISRLYKHLIQVTKGDSLLAPAKYELAARSLSSLLKKLSRIQSLSIQAADEHTLHVEDIYTFRDRIYRLEVVNSGIPDLFKLLAPNIKKKFWRHFKPMRIGTGAEERSAGGTGEAVEPFPLPSEQHCWRLLTHLRLCNCGLARLDPSLHLLPNLQQLDLSHNDLSHCIHLHSCHRLTLLNLSHNRLSMLATLPLVCANIQRLNLSYNQVAMLDGLGSLHSLVKLDLSHNLLDDIAELQHLVGLTELRELFLAGNPLPFAPSSTSYSSPSKNKNHSSSISSSNSSSTAGTGKEAAVSRHEKERRRRYRCEVLSCFLHDCSLQRRPLPLLDGLEMSAEEELQIKSSLFLPPDVCGLEETDGTIQDERYGHSLALNSTVCSSTIPSTCTSVDSDCRESQHSNSFTSVPPNSLLSTPLPSPARSISRANSHSSLFPSSSPPSDNNIPDLPVVLLNKTFDATFGISSSDLKPPLSGHYSHGVRGSCTNKSLNRREYFRRILESREQLLGGEGGVVLLPRRLVEVVDDPVLGQDYDHEFEAQIRRSVRVWDRERDKSGMVDRSADVSPKKKKGGRFLSSQHSMSSQHSHSSHNSLNELEERLMSNFAVSNSGNSTSSKSVQGSPTRDSNNSSSNNASIITPTRASRSNALSPSSLPPPFSMKDKDRDEDRSGADVLAEEGQQQGQDQLPLGTSNVSSLQGAGVSGSSPKFPLLQQQEEEVQEEEVSGTQSSSYSVLRDSPSPLIVQEVRKLTEAEAGMRSNLVAAQLSLKSQSTQVQHEKQVENSKDERIQESEKGEQAGDCGAIQTQMSDPSGLVGEEEKHQMEEQMLEENKNEQVPEGPWSRREHNMLSDHTLETAGREGVKEKENEIDDVEYRKEEVEIEIEAEQQQQRQQIQLNGEADDPSFLPLNTPLSNIVRELEVGGEEDGQTVEERKEERMLEDEEGEDSIMVRGHFVTEKRGSEQVCTVSSRSGSDMVNDGENTGEREIENDYSVNNDDAADSGDGDDGNCDDGDCDDDDDDGGGDDDDVDDDGDDDSGSDKRALSTFYEKCDDHNNDSDSLRRSDRETLSSVDSVMIASAEVKTATVTAFTSSASCSHNNINPSDSISREVSLSDEDVNDDDDDDDDDEVEEEMEDEDEKKKDQEEEYKKEEEETATSVSFSPRISDTSSLFTLSNERLSCVTDSPGAMQGVDNVYLLDTPPLSSSLSLRCSSLEEEEEEHDDKSSRDDNSSPIQTQPSTPTAASAPVLIKHRQGRCRRQYTGPDDFAHLPVLLHLEKYFREQVFGAGRPCAPSLYLQWGDDAEDNDKENEGGFFAVAPSGQEERVLGLYHEEVIESQHSDQLLPMIDTLSSSSSSSGNGSGDITTRLIFVLTDIHMYVVRDHFALPDATSSGSTSLPTFADAPVPSLHRLHPLETLRSCTLFFGFQRCSLHFHDMDRDTSRGDSSVEGCLSTSTSSTPAINWRKQGQKHSFGSPSKLSRGAGGGVSSDSMAVFVYMLLTKDKSKTHPIVSTVLPAANRLRDPEEHFPSTSLSGSPSVPVSLSRGRRAPLLKVEIRNKDSQFLDQVALLVHTHDALRGKGKGDKKGKVKGKGKTKNKSIVISPSSEEDPGGVHRAQEQGHVEAVDVVHCQLLSQEWRKKPGLREPRTLVVTPQCLLLCKEALDKQDVHLTLLDRVALKDVHKLLYDGGGEGGGGEQGGVDALAVTLVLSGSAANSSNKVTRSFATRKWRLRCSSASQAVKCVEECRRVCRELGNNI